MQEIELFHLERHVLSSGHLVDYIEIILDLERNSTKGSRAADASHRTVYQL